MISVLIPVYNGERYIERALGSVLAQTHKPDEIIVLDDGSTDTTADIVRAYNEVRLIQQPNQGIGPSRRRLVEEAKGDWIAFLDHDDFWLPEKLEEQIPSTLQDRVGLIHTRDVFFYEEDPAQRATTGTWQPPNEPTALDHVLPDCRINMSSVLVRKQAILEAGNFDGAVSKAEDWLMWLRLAAKWDF
ncbi:MAG: glycosyltransferase family 2 protein, partial [Fimbriimonas sp.]